MNARDSEKSLHLQDCAQPSANARSKAIPPCFGLVQADWRSKSMNAQYGTSRVSRARLRANLSAIDATVSK
jgi:hypothetical protein